MTTAARPFTNSFRWTAFFLLTIIFSALFLFAFFVLRSRNPFSIPSATVQIPLSVLEEKYGLRIDLIAVTAAGGKVDLRLKIINAAKARMILQGGKNYPSLMTKNGTVLSVPTDDRPETLNLVDNKNLYILFPNTGGSIQPGTAVTLRFGETIVEPIVSK